MAKFRSLEQITLNLLDYLRIVQPDLDTKPGSLARELIVDAPASELSKLYAELQNVANLQSVSSATGLELDRLANNYGLTRGSGAKASGTVVLTTNTLDADIPVPQGSIVASRSGVTYKTLAETSFLVTSSSVLRANAIRLRSSLDLAGITDEFALEVAVEATSFGSAGNVGTFSIINQSVSGLSNVTNTLSFTGGASTEDDNAFRARILGVFAGANLGTELGYKNAVIADPRVIDALVISSGDPLMVRDGTDTQINSSGVKVIVASGTGGKVDIYIQGSNLLEFTESYIFRDQSGKNDPTDSRNDFILGQRGINTDLDFQQRRQLSVAGGQLPFQPAENIVSVSGSLSGPNFIQKFTDSEGNVQGNFELLKDTGAFGGSSYGFDALHFISNEIKITDEIKSKITFNSEDSFDFTNVNKIDESRQNIVITNEHPILDRADRSLLTVRHAPIASVDRVVNLTTGQRYTVIDQNVDGVSGEQNVTGRIRISGGNTGASLPTSTDTLQLSYTWNQIYDKTIDFDNLSTFNNFRTVQDSIDWGFSNRVLAEEKQVVFSVADGYHIVVEHPVSRVVDVNTIVQETVANITGKLTVNNTITNVVSVKDAFNNESFFTAANNGAFSNKEITLPTDTLLLQSDLTNLPSGYVFGDVSYNATDIYSPDGYDTGSFDGNIIRLLSGTVSAGDTVFINYIANVRNLIPTTPLTNLPATGVGNQFVINSNIVGNQPVSYKFNGSSILRSLRFAPSYLKMNVTGISAQGRVTIKGTSFRRVEEIITVTQDSLVINTSTGIKENLKVTGVPFSVGLALIDKMERVTISGNDIIVDHTFDLLNYRIKNVDNSGETGLPDSNLTSTEFSLAATEENINNQPTTGQKIRLVYYYTNTNEIENVVFSTAGIQTSQFKYTNVERISINSGFIGLSGSTDGTLNIENFNQPVTGTTYFSTYRYVSPKEGERITIRYNYNRLIGDASFNLESVRPITADVLVKGAVSRAVDVSVLIVPTTAFSNNTTNLLQSVEEVITSFLTNQGLATIIDASDLNNAIYSVSGVDRVTLTTFNLTGNTGVVRSLITDRNEFFTAGIISAIIEER